jgi:hypothetical protein
MPAELADPTKTIDRRLHGTEHALSDHLGVRGLGA